MPSRISNGFEAGSARGAVSALGNATVAGTTQFEGILAIGPGALEDGDEDTGRKVARLNIK